jgi:hypothetical protein
MEKRFFAALAIALTVAGLKWHSMQAILCYITTLSVAALTFFGIGRMFRRYGPDYADVIVGTAITQLVVTVLAYAVMIPMALAKLPGNWLFAGFVVMAAQVGAMSGWVAAGLRLLARNRSVGQSPGPLMRW